MLISASNTEFRNGNTEVLIVFGSSVGRVKPQLELDVDRPARMARHDWRRAPVDLPAYLASGLPAETMGRRLVEDSLFFAAALAGGTVLAGMCGRVEDHAEGRTA